MPRLRTLTYDAAVLLLAAVMAVWARSHRYADTLALRHLTIANSAGIGLRGPAAAP